jgi:hypothetical protein
MIYVLILIEFSLLGTYVDDSEIVDEIRNDLEMTSEMMKNIQNNIHRTEIPECMLLLCF